MKTTLPWQPTFRTMLEYAWALKNGKPFRFDLSKGEKLSNYLREFHPELKFSCEQDGDKLIITPEND